MIKPNPHFQKLLLDATSKPKLTISPEAVAAIEEHLATLAHKRKVKAEQMKRYRARQKAAKT